MADKKKTQDEGYQEQGDMAVTVQCPQHDLPLQIQTENYETAEGKTGFRKFAVCTCNVPDNEYRGQRVWEQTD